MVTKPTFNKSQALIGNIQGFIEDINVPSDKDRIINQLICLVVFKNQHIYIVEDTELWLSFKYDNTPVSGENIKETMIKLMEIIEKMITSDMTDVRQWSIVHDRLTCNGVHYLGLLASYG